MTNITKVELKNYKGSGGEETTRFEASLYANDKRVATVSNSGTGGCHSYYWHDRESEKVFIEHIQKLDSKGYFKEYQDFFAKEYFPTGNVPPSFSTVTMDDYIEDLIFLCKVKKVCKKSLCYRLKSDEYATYRKMNSPYSPAAKSWLKEMHREKLKEILNERFIEDIERKAN